MGGRPPALGVLLAALIAAAGASPRDAEPSLKDIVRRMTAYVDAYGGKASAVVGTEHYTQDFSATGEVTQHRALVADFALAKAESTGTWIGFRDVIEVDGQSLPDREGRLMQMLSASGSPDEARRLSDESARFNLGPVLRNFNVPTSALFFFTSGNVHRFKFARKSVDPAGVWEIAFRETVRPTLIRTPDGQSLPSEGIVRVASADGTVVGTRLQVSDFSRGIGSVHESAQIDVEYQRVPAIDMWLPASMTETYDSSRGTYLERVSTRAQYGGYRTFQTSARIK